MRNEEDKDSCLDRARSSYFGLQISASRGATGAPV